jgi:hypothetical protein
MELTTPSHDSRGGADSAVAGASTESGTSQLYNGRISSNCRFPRSDGGVTIYKRGSYKVLLLARRSIRRTRIRHAVPRRAALTACQPKEENNPVRGGAGIL